VQRRPVDCHCAASDRATCAAVLPSSACGSCATATGVGGHLFREDAAQILTYPGYAGSTVRWCKRARRGRAQSPDAAMFTVSRCCVVDFHRAFGATFQWPAASVRKLSSPRLSSTWYVIPPRAAWCRGHSCDVPVLSVQFLVRLVVVKNGIAAGTAGGVHIHEGTSCASADEVGGHLYDADFVPNAAASDEEVDHTSNCSWYSDPAHNLTDADAPLKYVVPPTCRQRRHG